MRDRLCWRGPAGCRRRYSSHPQSAASKPVARAPSPAMIRRLAGLAAAGIAELAGEGVTVGAGPAGWVTLGVVTGGIVEGGVPMPPPSMLTWVGPSA